MNKKQVPLYIQIKNHLLNEIANGTLSPGDKVLSEQQLAEKFSVSRITSRQALSELVNEGILIRKPGKGTFVRTVEQTSSASDQDGQVVSRTAGSRSIGLVVPLASDHYIADIVIGFERAVKEHGYNLLLVNSDNDAQMESTAISRLVGESVSGICLFPCDSSRAHVEVQKLASDGFPVVLVDRYFVGGDVPYVVSDGFGGMYTATKHLLNLGYKRIGYVATPLKHLSSNRDRLWGYRHALLTGGMPYLPELVFSDFPLEWQFQTEVSDTGVLERYLEEARPDAIITLNELIAIFMLSHLPRMGFQVPEDIGVVGFDGRKIAVHFQVPLTTVWQPAQDIGYSAGRLVLDTVKGRAEVTRITLPTKLIVRESCGHKFRNVG